MFLKKLSKLFQKLLVKKYNYMKVYDTNIIKDQFPALQRKVWNKKLVYLDSAASMQKPKRVLDAISKSYSFNYSN